MRTGSNMTDFLVKTFVKDYENTGDIGVRTEYGLMASTVGICCNVLLFAAKLFIGLLINSISVMADAFNNLSDAASSIIEMCIRDRIRSIFRILWRRCRNLIS